MNDIRVLLIGASGALGKPILDVLKDQKAHFARVAILATPDRASKFTNLHAEVVVGSLWDSASYKGFTHVISAVGNSLMILQPAMIEAAISAGVRHWYASEWNSDIAQKQLYNMRYFRDKQAVRAFLRARAAATPKFQYTLVITGLFTEWAVGEFHGFNQEQHIASLYGRPGQRVGVTSIPDIARYTVESLRLPFDGAERTLRVQSWTGKVEELVAALEEAQGVQYTINYVDPQKAAEKEEEARLKADDLGEMMYSIKPLLASGYGVADACGPLDNEKFDFQPEQPLETFRRIFSSGR